MKTIRIEGGENGQFHVYDANSAAEIRGVSKVTVELDAERGIPIAVLRIINPEVTVTPLLSSPGAS